MKIASYPATPAKILIAAALLSPSLAGAAESAAPNGARKQAFAPQIALTPKTENRPRITATADYSYSRGDAERFQTARGSETEVQSLTGGLATTIKLSDRWFLPLGLSTAHYFFDTDSSAPIPDSFHTIRLLPGIGYAFNPQWSLSLNLGGSLYRLDDVEGNDLGASGLINLVYKARPDLTWAFAIVANPDSDIPVIPAAGVRWDINPEWTLNLMYPRPLVIYRPDEKLDLYAGADIRFTVFRSDDETGDGISNDRYNDALASYRDLRLGAGAEYEVLKNFWAAIEGGYSVWREIEYTRIDETVDFDPAPYIQLAVRYRF